jgi:hypothetical protein
VAESTIPTLLGDVAQVLQPDKSYQVDEVAHLIKMPNMITQRLLENLSMLHILEREKQSVMRSSFKMQNDFAELLIQSQLYSKES